MTRGPDGRTDTAPFRRIERLLGASYRFQFSHLFDRSTGRFNRPAFRAFCEVYGIADRYGWLLDSDIFWDRVVSIEDVGERHVYDLTVEGLHNFVAEDIIVHNSIEQDADVVMFIYRDEYYNKESERLGEADMIVAKHRNGPIGDVALTFLPKYPKFANLYRDRGAEPMPPQDAAV